MSLSPGNAALRAFFVLAYGVVFLALTTFWPFVSPDDGLAWSYVVAATAAYAAVYLLPALLLTLLLDRLLPGREASARWRQRLLLGVATVGTATILLLLYADYRLYELYQFHINKFVINLIRTPGGIAALGATPESERTAAGQVALVVAGCLALPWLALRFSGLHQLISSRRFLLGSLALVLVFSGQEVVFAHSRYTGNESILEAADATPFRFTLKFSRLFKTLGVKRASVSEQRLAGGTVHYPAQPIELKPQGAPPNIIMLVAESFRWDLLDPQITPNLWAFSQRATRYENHYSGGNRTRMGLFSLFYGLYAPYWYSFEKQRVAPVLMDVLRKRDYQFAIHTSQSFDYPELRHTTFAGVPENLLQEIKEGEPWQRDERNIGDIIAKLDGRDSKKPFYSFMFFESTHAPYSFPEADALRADYVREVNYARLNLKENIGGLHARYVNAAHHIDRQVGRLLDELKRRGMLDNTIILFTGDHGEEFMEKGHWGHGHGTTFIEEQVRVPFILSVPGKAPAVVTTRTSHLQFAPTLLKYLGVTNPPEDFSSADSLDHTLPYLVFGEYDLMGIMDQDFKISFPYTASYVFRYTVQTVADRPVKIEDRKQALTQREALLKEITAESRRFVR